MLSVQDWRKWCGRNEGPHTGARHWPGLKLAARRAGLGLCGRCSRCRRRGGPARQALTHEGAPRVAREVLPPRVRIAGPHPILLRGLRRARLTTPGRRRHAARQAFAHERPAAVSFEVSTARFRVACPHSLLLGCLGSGRRALCSGSRCRGQSTRRRRCSRRGRSLSKDGGGYCDGQNRSEDHGRGSILEGHDDSPSGPDARGPRQESAVAAPGGK